MYSQLGLQRNVKKYMLNITLFYWVYRFYIVLSQPGLLSRIALALQARDQGSNPRLAHHSRHSSEYVSIRPTSG